MQKRGGSVLIFWGIFMLFVCVSDVAIAKNRDDSSQLVGAAKNKTKRQERKEKRKKSNHLGTAVGGVFKDILYLHKNILDWDSFKIWGTIFPLFVGGRMVDKKIHSCFYDAENHKNLNQAPDWCRRLARFSVGVPITILAVKSFFPSSEDIQATSRVFLIGLPFLIWGKELMKAVRFEENLRPRNERFPNKDCLGGFPSGHMAEAVYTAMLFGRRFGPRFGVPLWFVAGLVGATFTVCNRHYFSQIIAGAGLGAMYAYAADKLINKNLGKNLKFSFEVDSRGTAHFGFNHRF